MLAIFQRGSRVLQTVEDVTAALPPDTIWIDLQEPTEPEVQRIENELDIELPSRAEMQEIEASARVYEEDEALFLTATLIVKLDSPPIGTTVVTFILKGDRLVTLRYADPQPFRTIRSRLKRQAATLPNGTLVFFWLVDLIVARLADVLELSAIDADGLSQQIFGAARMKPKDERPDLLEAIERIGRNGDAASKVRESLHTLQRILLAIGTTEILPPGVKKEARARAKALNRDVSSVTEQASFLTGKIDLLLNATLGIINIEQNAIIKLFSVLSIVLLPPTLIASIEGMNFRYMPELEWAWGYPFSILLMVLSAVLPFILFRYKGWL